MRLRCGTKHSLLLLGRTLLAMCGIRCEAKTRKLSVSVHVCISVCGIIAPKRMNRFWSDYLCLKGDLINNVLIYDSRIYIPPFQNYQIFSRCFELFFKFFKNNYQIFIVIFDFLVYTYLYFYYKYFREESRTYGGENERVRQALVSHVVGPHRGGSTARRVLAVFDRVWYIFVCIFLLFLLFCF